MSGSEALRAPFPWFGGKRRVASIVWPRFGDVPNYIEPFAGSLAMLLGRPGGAGKIETVNDIDRYVANFWRALKADPWGVASWCDDPVNEADLHARHLWLVNQTEFRERMHRDPYHYDVRIAGWWVWGLCQWIGGGWCVEPQNRKHPKLDGIGKGVHSLAGAGIESVTELDRKRPHLAGMDKGVLQQEPPNKLPFLAVKSDGNHAGRGIHSTAVPSAQIPNLRVTDNATGSGVHRGTLLGEAYSPGRRPSLSNAGQGVHLPGLGNDRGVHGLTGQDVTFLESLRALSVPNAPPCFAWFAELSLRLRRVRIACGDWKRVLGASVLGKGKNVGGRRPCAVFLDPPYDPELRSSTLYAEDARGISADVRRWALENGDDPDIRIALCGYEGEHEMPASWECVEWKAARGYAGADNENRAKERIWFSPHCIKPSDTDPRRQSSFDFGVTLAA